MNRIAAFAATVLVCLGIGVHSQTLPPPARPLANASQIQYDNTTSGLSATQVQAAIDELDSGGGGGGGHVIKDDAGVRPQQGTLFFTGGGVTCTDDDPNDQTVCSIAGAGPGSGIVELIADSPAGGTTGTSIILAGSTNGIATSRAGDTITISFVATEVAASTWTDAQVQDIALTTGTSGNYVSSATLNQGLFVTGTEGASIGFQDCGPNEILKMDGAGTAWTCQADGGTGGSGDVTDVGNCDGPACFTGTDGSTLTSTLGEVIDFGAAQSTFTFRSDTVGPTIIQGDTTAAADNTVFTTAGTNGTITVGSASVNTITLSTNSTGDAEVVLPVGAVGGGTGGEITANSIDAFNLINALDLGSETSLEIPNSTNPTMTTFGQIAGDSDLWAAGRGAPVFFDGTSTTALVNVLLSPAPTDGQVPTWHATGITWGSAGVAAATSLDAGETGTTNDIRYDTTTDFWYEDRNNNGFTPGEELELGPVQKTKVVTATANLGGNTSILDGDDIRLAVEACGVGAAGNGCEVRLLEGTYVDVCEYIRDKRDLRIVGKGWGKTILKPYTQTGDCHGNVPTGGDPLEGPAAAMLQFAGMDNFEIAYIEADGDKETAFYPIVASTPPGDAPAPNYRGAFIRFDDPGATPNSNLLVHHIYAHDLMGSAIYVVYGDRMTIYNNRIENNGCSTATDLAATNGGCGCTAAPDGAACRGWTAAAFAEPPYNKSNANGINMEGGTTHNSIVYQNYIANMSKIGLEVTGAPPCGEANTCGEGHQLVDNTLVNASLILNGAQRVTVARNRISGSKDRDGTGDFGSGLMLVASSVSNILIENNLIYDNDGSGMVIKPQGPGNVTIRGNLLKNNCITHPGAGTGGNLVIWSAGGALPAKNLLVEDNTVVASPTCTYALRSDNNGGGGGALSWSGSVIFRGGLYSSGVTNAVLIDNPNVEVRGLTVASGNLVLGANAHGIAVANTGTVVNTGGVCVMTDTTTPIPAGCIAGGGGGGGWGVASNVVSLSNTTDEVVIGGSTVATNGAKVSIDGDTANQILLNVQGHATQTTPLLNLENSTGADVFSVDVNGQVTMAAHPTLGGSLVLKEASSIGTDTFTLKVNDAGVVPFLCTIDPTSGRIPDSCIGDGTDGGGAGGAFTNLTLSANSGPDQTLNDTNTIEIAGGTGIDTVASATDTVTANFKYTSTLTTGTTLNAEECVFTTAGTGGGGLLCEGNAGANANQQLWLFPASDGADTTGFFATDSTLPVTEIDGGGLSVVSQTLQVTSTELDFIFNSNSATVTQDGAMSIDENGDAANFINPVLQFQGAGADFLIFAPTAYPTVDGQVLAFQAATDTMAWVTPSGGVTDGDKGDITITGGVWAIDPAAVALSTDVTGLLPVANGGTGVAPASDDQVFVSSSTSAGAWDAVPDCDDTGGNHINYDTTANNFTCGTSSGGAGAWTDTGSVVHLNNAARDVVIGATTAINGAKVTIDGDEDEVQLTMQGHTTQTANFITLEDSATVDVFTVEADGDVLGKSFQSAATATPNLLLVDNHANAGEGQILVDGDAAGPDSLMDLRVDVAGALTSFIQLDGITETVDILKPITLSTALTDAQVGDIALTTGTSGDYVATVADGTGIDGTATGEGSTYTPTLDLTEQNSQVLGNGTFTTLQFNAGATDPTFTFGSDSVSVSSVATWTFNGNTVLSADLNEGLSGGGLTDCDGAAQTLGWDSATNKFTCGDDSTGGSSIDDTAFASSWNGVTATAPSKNVVYDWGHIFDTDDDGFVNLVEVIDAAADTTTSVTLSSDPTGNLATLTDPGLTYNASTNALTATTFVGALTGTASAATALAGDPADCGANTWATGIATSGALTCSAISGGTGITDGTIASADIATELRSMFWDAGAFSTDGTGCTVPAEITVAAAGSPKTWTVNCPTDGATSIIYGKTRMPDSWDGGTVTFSPGIVNTNATPSNTYILTFSAQCRTPGTDVISATWGTGVAATATFATQYRFEAPTTTAVTPDPAGTCAGNDILFWRAISQSGTTTQEASVYILGVKMEYTSNVGDTP